MKRRGRTGQVGALPAARALAAELLVPALALLLICQIVSGFLVAPMFSLFPIFVEKELGFPADFSGKIRAFFVLTGGLTALAGGAMADAFGRKQTYLLAMTGVIAAGLLFLVREPAGMYALALYSGLMFGLGSVAGQSYLMEAAPERSLGLATACYFMASTVGNALGSPAAAWIAAEVPQGYRWLGIGMVAGQAALLAVAWRLLPNLTRRAASRNPAELAAGLGALLRRREVWLLLGLRFLSTVYWGATTLLMPLLLFRLAGSEKPAGYYTAASLAVAAAAQFGAGRIVDRAGPRALVLTAISLVTAASIGQALFARDAVGLAAFGLLGAGAAWSLSITMTTLVQVLSEETTKGRLLGLTHLAWAAGFVAGTLMGGYLGRTPAGGAAAFAASAGCCAGAIACAAGVVAPLPKRPVRPGDAAPSGSSS